MVSSSPKQPAVHDRVRLSGRALLCLALQFSLFAVIVSAQNATPNSPKLCYFARQRAAGVGATLRSLPVRWVLAANTARHYPKLRHLRPLRKIVAASTISLPRCLYRKRYGHGLAAGPSQLASAGLSGRDYANSRWHWN